MPAKKAKPVVPVVGDIVYWVDHLLMLRPALVLEVYGSADNPRLSLKVFTVQGDSVRQGVERGSLPGSWKARDAVI